MLHPLARVSEPLMLRGSLIVLRRKCGKASCRCMDGAPHETAALSCSVGGTTQVLTLRPDDVRVVRDALYRYRKSLSALDRQAMAGIATLRRYLDAERAKRRGARR